MQRLILAALAINLVGTLCASGRSITVAAGDVDRRNTLVTFPYPDPPRVKTDLALEDERGGRMPMQIINQGDSEVGVFVLPELKAGQRLKLNVVEGAIQPPAAEARRDPKQGSGSVELLVNQQAALRYQGEKGGLPEGFPPTFERGGYIAWVRTPDGKLVTDDYPPNHKHHHGIWSPWTKTEFEGRHPDFWNMGDKTGTVEFVGLDDTFSGPVAAGFVANHKFIDLSASPPKAALNEQWRAQVYNVPADPGTKRYFLFDWTSTQTCATNSPLKLLQYRYGGLGVRGNREWDGPDKLTFVTSEGKDRKTGNESRARWAYMGGQVDGAACGIAILCAPDDFRFPQPVRIHPTEPFFCYAPSQSGEFKIEPGTPYVARYRFVILDGGFDAQTKDLIERLWKDYADGPKVGE